MKQLYWPGELQIDGPMVPDADTRHRLRKVLRLRSGALLTLADGRGTRLACRWTGRDLVAIGPFEAREVDEAQVHLVAGLLKGERWQWLIEKAVEVGVDRLLPAAMEHCVARVAREKGGAKRQRWLTVAREAFEQCGRATLPDVDEPQSLQTILGARVQGALAYCDETDGVALADWHASATGLHRTLVVGPEGGISASERELLAANGGVPVSLGPNVLRSETAAIVGVALLRSPMQRAHHV